MQGDPYTARKLSFQLQVSDGRIFAKPFDDYTNHFLRKTWSLIINEIFDGSHIQKVNPYFVLFKQSFLFKDLKTFKKLIQKKLNAIRFCSSLNVYKRGVQQNVQKVFGINITIKEKDSKEEKRSYREFIISYEARQITSVASEQDSLSFGTGDASSGRTLDTKPVIKRTRHHFAPKENQVQFKLSKVQFIIFYYHEHHSKIKQVLGHLEQNREEWLLYPLNPYLDTFSLDKIYYEEFLQKTLAKKSSQIHKILELFNLEMIDKKVKLLRSETINRSPEDPEHPDLEQGFYLGFHIFGQVKNFYQFYFKINEFFQSRKMWVLRPEKICCCSSLADLQTYMKEKENLETYLIYDHIVVIIKSPEEVSSLTSIKNRSGKSENQDLSEEQRLLQILQTGEFTLDTNDFDHQDLEYIYKERQRYKAYLEKQYRVNVTYLTTSTKRKLYLLCELSAYRLFKGSIYSFINDFKSEKEHLRQFNTPFHVHIFDKYLKKDLQAQFPQIKFAIKKKAKIQQVWCKFHAKDRTQFMQRLNQMVKKFQHSLDYIACKKEPLPQNWFALYRRPHVLSIHTLTCRKYVISRDTKVYVQPYQALSRPVDEMLFLIDHSFESCWEFVEIAEQNKLNLMSLFLEFQERKTKKPDRIKAIPLSNHRYINKMLLWYNDMLKKIESRRQQDIKKLYKRYQDKKQMHIMIPRHATHSILLNFVLPSFIKEFTQQTGYNLKEIFFYYPILFDEGHQYVESLTLKVIDEEMQKANIELQNENYLTKDSVKKILQMEYLRLHCSFQGDQRIWKASSLSSYVFYIEREVIIHKKTKLCKKASPQLQKKLMNFMVPLFFMDASFNNEIVVDLAEEWFYLIGKVSVEGPFEIKSDQKYGQIAKCVNCIKKIFRSLSYVVLYVDKDFQVSKNGYYYTHKDFIEGRSVIYEEPNDQLKNFKKSKAQTNMTFNDLPHASNASASIHKLQSQSQSFQKNKINQLPQANRVKIILYPMRLQMNTLNSHRSRNFDDSGKIMKRQSKRLIIDMIESEIPIWYMAETFKQRIPQLQQYLKNPNNYKNNENNLLGDISEYSILDLKDQKEDSRFLNFEDEASGNKMSEQQKQQTLNANHDASMGFIDLSVIHYGENDQSMNKNNMSDKMSFLDQINTDEMNDMSIYSTQNP